MYTGAAMLPRYLGNPAASAAALPFYTEANQEALSLETDFKKASRLAERILRQNAYIAEAYDVKAAAAYQQEDYAGLLSNKKESLALQRYDMNAYRRYIAILSQALQKAARAEEEENVRLLLQGILEAEEIMSPAG